MNALSAAGWVVRVTGLVQVVLGLLIWAGVADAIVPVHMLIGIVLVVALWTTAVLGLQAGSKPVLAGIAIAWGLLTIAFGLTQEQILPDDMHVVVEVGHLVVGLVAMGLGEMLVAAGRRGTAATA
jgi:hypothetical protein